MCPMKRVLYILGVFSFSLLLVLILLTAVLMSDRVQTAAVQFVTEEFAKALGTEAHIGEVRYHFPAKVSIHDIYLEDQYQDTLLYVDEIYVHLRPLALIRGEVQISHAHINTAVSKLYQKDSVWNYQFFVDGLGLNKSSDSEPTSTLFGVHDIRFDSIRVEYEDYKVLLSHAAMDLHHLIPRDGAIDAELSELAMNISKKSEPSIAPYEVRNLSARMIKNDSVFRFPVLKGQLANSRLDLSGVELTPPYAVHFHEATIVPADFAIFAPELKGLTRPITISGAIGGTMDSLRCENLAVDYNRRPFFKGDLSVMGLPNTDSVYLRADFKDIQTNAARLQDFISRLENRPVQLPQALHRLGEIHYHGLLEGTLHDLTLHGGFRTALGSISTDGTLVSDSAFEHLSYEARIEGRNFRLGKLLDEPKLTTVTLGLYSKGQVDNGEVRGDIEAHVKQLHYNDYTFNDLHFNGRYEPQLYNGECSIDDPHMKIDFDGKVNLREKDPEVNFNLRCHHFDMAPFTDDHDPTVQTSFALAIDMNGDEAEELSGYVVIDSLAVATKYDSVLIRQLTLTASAAPDHSKALAFHSDNLHVVIEGVFRYEDLVPSCQSLAHHYLPSVIDEPSQNWLPVSLSVRAGGERLRDVQRLFQAPITISDHTTLSADLDIAPPRLRKSPEPYVNMRFFAPGIRWEETPIHDLLFTLQTVDTLRNRLNNNPYGLAFTASAEVNNTQLDFSTVAFRDTLLSRVQFAHEEQNNDSIMADLSGWDLYLARIDAQRDGKYEGDIHFITHLGRYDKKPLIDLHFLPAQFILRDSTYTLSESYMTYCAAETWLDVDHFSLAGAGQLIRANGMASEKPTDTLSVQLQRLDASYVVPFVLAKQSITFNGYLTGQADITGVFGEPRVESLIHVDSMGLNDCYFGEAEVDLHVYPTRQLADTVLPAELRFHANVDRPTRRVVSLDGEANFATGAWNLDMDADSVPLGFINHWTSDVLDSLEGYGTGKVIVGDRGTGVYVLLRTLAQDASLTLPWTGVRYHIASDSINMDTTAILFPDVHMTDAEENPVELTGAIHHKNFLDYVLDLHVDTHDALVFDMNTPGDMIQGSVYATGHVDVTGDEMDLIVAAEAKTSKNSRFRLSLDYTSSAYESNFIHFIEHPSKDSTLVIETDRDNIDKKRVVRVKDIYTPTGRCLLKLNLDVNPFLLFQLVLGERSGDMIQARGSGAISLTYDTQTEDVSLLGTYEMEQGSLSYTVANVIRKVFTIGAGSTIVFSGNASNPQMDVTAKYRVTASLKDLLGDEAGQFTSRTNIPVLTCLHMSGALNNPLLSFSLEFPMSDQSVQQQVKQAINTDEMLMRQVIYLLVFGRFLTPESISSAQYATLNSTYSLLSSTVTGQINAWLSKLTNMLTLGVAIRTDGEGADASQEYEAQFQLQPVDRLVINGNFGYRYNDISNQPFFGDLDVEVLLTEDGQWRIKGYTHTVDKYTLRQASTIQGFGFLWKKDF